MINAREYEENMVRAGMFDVWAFQVGAFAFVKL
jgi:hypothetical protein